MFSQYGNESTRAYVGPGGELSSKNNEQERPRSSFVTLEISMFLSPERRRAEWNLLQHQAKRYLPEVFVCNKTEWLVSVQCITRGPVRVN